MHFRSWVELRLKVPQKIKEGPEIFKALCEASLDCVKEAKFDEEAQKVFKTEAVQDVLQSTMRTSISALELISRYYSSRGGALLASLLTHCFSTCPQLPLMHNRLPRR